MISSDFKYYNLIFIYKMKGFMTKLTESLRTIDLFSTSQFLRYRSQSEYKTSSGGLASLLVIIINILLFYNMGILTIDRQIINSSTSIQSDADPTSIQFETNLQNKFTFVLGIPYLNLNNQTLQYFNISLKQNNYGPGFKFLNSTNIPLEQCTIDHLDFNDDIRASLQNFQYSHFLCAPKNYTYKLAGKMTSLKFDNLDITVSKCNSSINAKCATNAQLAYIQSQLGKFTIYLGVINSLVNPNDKEYLKLYFEERNYFYFSVASQMGVEAIAQIQKSIIQTDQSIMPYEDIIEQQILTIPNTFIQKNTPVINDTYVKIEFKKSTKTTTYKRSFNKLDNFVSYAGGLIGSLLVIFFILNKYSEVSYVIDFSYQIFKKEGEQGNDFNFLEYGKMCLYSFLKIIKLDNLMNNWQKTAKLNSFFQEMQSQLSIDYILKKIIHLQQAISVILKEEELHILFLKQKKTSQQFEQIRLTHEAFNEISTCSTQTQKQQPQHQDKQTNKQMIIQPPQIKLSPTLNISEVKMISAFEETLNQIFQRAKNYNQIQGLRQDLKKLIAEKKRGDKISQRILQKVDDRVMVYLGIDLKDQKDQSYTPFNPFAFLDNKQINKGQQKDRSVIIQQMQSP